jgi:alanyl-tRNA synthetase
MASSFTSPELREKFIDFFVSKKHVELPAAPLVPKGDPTLLFTSAGMVQFKEYYVSPPPAGRRRAVTIQKCLRASDLELVGTSPRHHTFFEMLGNFSFGDYFKREAVAWAWDFVISEMGIDREALSASVFEEDDEAHEIWVKEIGLPPDRVVALGAADNWWGPAGSTGPCGPCSEIYYDMGPEAGCGRPECKPGCDCNRYIEFWNLVFPQFHQDETGARSPLPSPGIDTGMGLERLAVIVQGRSTVYETDLLAPVVAAVREMASGEGSGRGDGEAPGAVTALRVISDHVRGLVFALAEGVLPSNEGRGYLIRRILRRAVRRGFDLGLHEPFLHRLVPAVSEVMGASPKLYGYLGERSAHVVTVMRGEEERFFRTIEAGVAKFAEMASTLESDGAGTFPGEWAFVLYDTYGFPPDMTREMATEKGLSWDEDGLEREMEKQRQRARKAAAFDAEAGETREWVTLAEGEDSAFTGYESPAERSRVMRYRLGPGENEIEIVLDRTPFYAESGGQVADTGWIRWPGGEVEVTAVYKDGDSIVHRGKMSAGDSAPDPFPEKVGAEIDARRRLSIARNHTATHLLHAALRKVLGDHVMQAGSLVAPDRLRFDFSHYGPLNPEEIDRIEREVNEAVAKDVPVTTVETTLEEARASGAMALFDEKYGDSVRQVTVNRVSSEVCGGTHVGRSGEVGPFILASQSAIGSGMRRVEALTGDGALSYLKDRDRTLKALEEALGAKGDGAVDRARSLLAERDRLAKRASSARDRDLSGLADDLADGAQEVGGVRFVAAQVPPAAVPELRRMGDELRRRLKSGVGVLATVSDGKVSFIAVVTDDLVKGGRLRADRIVSQVAGVAGGSGGGKPHLALAGAKDAAKVKRALNEVKSILERELAG